LGPFEYWLTVFGRRFTIVSIAQELNYRIEVDGLSHRVDRDAGGLVHAPAPAVVVSIAVQPWDTVSAGDRVAVLEAMKMEMEVGAPFSGQVRAVMAIPNVQVDAGTPLLQIEPAAIQQAIPSTEPLNFTAVLPPQGITHDKSLSGFENLQQVRQFMLGFDVDPAQTARLLSDSTRDCVAPEDADEMVRREDETLHIFVDICSLFHREPRVDGSNSAEVASAETQLFTYLRALDTRGAGLPSGFVDALRRTLGYYGVQTLERSPELEQALLWVYKSHQRIEQQTALVLAVLHHRLEQVEAFAPRAGEAFRELLERIISVTRGTLPAVSDLAQELRYRCFDQPVFERARQQ